MKTIAATARFGAVFLMAAASAAEFQPGQYDEVVLDHLRDMARAAPLRTLAVRDMAPDFAIPKLENLTWDEALAAANRRLGETQPARALFLRKYLSKGAPESRLLELRWPRSMLGVVSGPTTYSSLEWHGVDQAVKGLPINLRSRDGGETSLSLEGSAKNMPIEINGRNGTKTSISPPVERRVIARIHTAICGNELTDVPSLSIPDVLVKGLLFDLLSFDENDRLVSVMQHFTLEPEGREVRLHCSARSAGPDGFSATVSDAAESSESLEYSPALVLKARWVQLHGRMSYHEFYKDGRLRERVHTDRQPTSDDKGRYIEKIEKFP